MEKSSSWLGYDCCIPDDIIDLILIRLPVKSLVRFKTVSKSWNSIITNPTFAKTQFHHSTTHHVTSSHIILREDNTMFTLHLDLDNLPNNNINKRNQEIKGKFVPISPKFNPIQEKKGFHVLGSCHGMLCVHVENTNDIHLWNPSTNESRLVPWPVSKSSKSFRKKLSGLGFVSATNDYKLVLAADYYFCYCSGSCTLVHVYSFRQNRWRDVDLPLLSSIGFGHSYEDNVLLNDALYWTLIYRTSIHHGFILKFDMVNETFEKVEELNPDDYLHDEDEDRKKEEGRWYSLRYCIGTFENDDHHKQQQQQLCLCQRFHYSHWPKVEPKADVIEMWVLNEHYHEWKKKFKLRGRWDKLGNDHRLVKVAGNGKVIVFEKLVTYYHSTHARLENLLIFDWRRSRKGSFIHVNNEYTLPYKCSEPVYDVVNYVRSLISPNNIVD